MEERGIDVSSEELYGTVRVVQARDTHTTHYFLIAMTNEAFLPTVGTFRVVFDITYTFDISCIARVHYIPLVGVGKEEAHKQWSMVTPEPVTRTTLRTTGPMPADSRQ